MAGPVPLPPAPLPTGPAGGATVGCAFTLTWTPVAYPGALAYTVEMERLTPGTNTFDPWQRVEKITAPSYMVPQLSGGTFRARWRVWAGGPRVVGAASAWQDLSVQCVP